MTSNAQFSVYSTGEAEDGYEASLVKHEFAALFGISDEKADRYFASKKLIRKGLTQKQATEYQVNLKKIGMVTIIESNIVQSKASNEPNTKAEDTLGLLPEDHVDSTSNTGTSNQHTKGMTCPACHIDQIKSEQCIDCGVFFRKLSNTAETTTGRSEPTLNASEKASHQSSRRGQSDSANFILPVIAAGVTAIVLAFLWKLITIQTGYEFGIVAWAIGGVIGFVGASTGGRGEVAAVTCAILAVCAILGGKYMIEDYYIAQTDSFFDGELHDEMSSGYDKLNEEIEIYTAIENDDYLVKRFISDYGYTNADSVTEISDGELEEFRETMAFNIAAMEQVPDLQAALNEMQAEHEQEMGTDSTFSYMIENMGILGIIFIFLGMSTAYKIVRSN